MQAIVLSALVLGAPVQMTVQIGSGDEEALAYAIRSLPTSAKRVADPLVLAMLFIRYGSRWGVEPAVVACVAYRESRFNPDPRMYRRRCRTRLEGCQRPGPCNARFIRRCKWELVSKGEVGLMQVLWYDRSTRAGYSACTGGRLRGGREARKIALLPLKVNVCVGAYELAKWRWWALKGGLGKLPCRKRGGVCTYRTRPRGARNVKFFRAHPELLRLFWVAFYNWGSNKWVGNSYPRDIARCYNKVTKLVAEHRRANAQRKE